MNWQPVAKAPMEPDASVTFESNTYLVTDGHHVATCDFARGNGAGKPWADWSMYGGIGAGLITHWMPLPAAPGEKCRTCSGHGAVGNILTAEPCPDCTPAAAAPSAHVGLLAAAAHIQAKAQAHLDERGSYDPDTGAVEMSESNQEYFNTLDELAEEIRLMADKAAPASCDKPPAGWNCSRTPGHDGPCAAAPAAIVAAKESP
ncbi:MULTISPECIES: DUF551 domain-containing protein [Delftia]|uniref:DUF551 domain-containing protein n=1 Tax=Delftia lacustris TaxID=558537 RepID=A0A1H3TTY6_9BURK|nr:MULTISPECIES: DUF551 domain-containing protein [Delftia]WEM00068.1 DUF551 domain-containing protein [Delftia tsuruhatensis]SDZ53693.1 hypothetical protein SAMN05421547_13276 [Delftia lacustris]